MNKTSKKKGHVLLLEDDPMIQFIHGQYLKALGYSYDLAKTGEEAIALYNTNRYNFMLLDKQLPDMDSAEFCQLVRSEHSKGDLPIFIVTASGKISEEASIKAGYNEFFIKPLNQKKLEAAINRWIGLSKSAIYNHLFFKSNRKEENDTNRPKTDSRIINHQ